MKYNQITDEDRHSSVESAKHAAKKMIEDGHRDEMLVKLVGMIREIQLLVIDLWNVADKTELDGGK